MRRHLRTTLATATVGALTGGLLVAVAGSAAAVSGLEGDFNGDGYRDVAIGAASATVSGQAQAGAVVVLYGSSSGVSATRRTVIHQNSASVPGAAESGDLFGSNLAAGDLDRDGYSDLVVGASNEAIGDRDGVGSATVLWGGPSGLYGGKGLPQPSTLSEFTNFGNGVATGDFDGDGDTDVTVTGRTHTRLYNGPFTRAGGPLSNTRVGEVGTLYDVTAGDLTGDGAAERVYPHAVDGDPGGKVYYFRWTGMTHTMTELPSADGFPGAIADIDGDGYGDLVLGDPTDPSADKPGGHKGGQITVWYGGPNGPDPAQKPTVVHQDTAGVPGEGESGDAFGSAVGVGDINGDRYADVVVGAPGEALGSTHHAGMVTVLFGSASGLTTSGAKGYSQNTSGVPGTAEAGDAFGKAVRLVDLDRNGKADLVAGTAYENGYGMVTHLRGTSTGLTTQGAKNITAADVSLQGNADFGWAIAP
ncbi:FG-GAP-like repeat-containing protein [Streptomyces sp. NPDC006624]|uniref:FG-GAP-like repeat-containing protein n=1 Tax=Streptomyces sp. NPDC006624 TaxID=3154892 RepID=UPI0033A64EB2